MQKNVIREWLTQPVGDDHSVYDRAHDMLMYAFNASDVMSETEVYRYQKPQPYYGKTQYLSAAEGYPIVDQVNKKRKKKKSKKAKESNFGRIGILVDLDTDGVELDVYKDEAEDSEKLPVRNVFV